ncbi:hypothetical protein ABZ153_25030 [Streptomyces sp. NPDC006290]|uniref:hypothetical protein n=1 Tax=Streptomyces sp. NPDC006290 TaxID=3156745 RepID=UPI0033A8C56B
MSLSSRSERMSAEAEELRELLADAAYDVTPSAVPLVAIEREGRRRRRRRRTTVLGAACGALLVPLAVVGLHDGAGLGFGESASSPAAHGHSATPSPAETAGRVRVVASGERVRVASGAEIWLTKEGSHWTEPGMPVQSHGIMNANPDPSGPRVSLQASYWNDGRTLLSGVFRGSGEVARVEVTTAAGVVHATALTLAGRPGWGAWYAVTPAPPTPAPDNAPSVDPLRVTVYDSSGAVLVSQGYRP